MEPMNGYVAAIREKLATGIAQEHAHRPALEALLKRLRPEATPVNEPGHVPFGRPDIGITKAGVSTAYVECKDIDADLKRAEKSEQFKRYREAWPNLILTDYLTFRWYIEGKLVKEAQLGHVEDDERTLKTTHQGMEDVEALLREFLEHETPQVGTAKQLAERMASLARMIRYATLEVLRTEGGTGGSPVGAVEDDGATASHARAAHATVPTPGPLHAQLQAFREVLVPGLSEDEFADMYAQTIAYGLFAARCNHRGPQPFSRQSAAWDLPKTNPFLQKLFNEIAGPSLDARIAWIVDDLARLLAVALMDNVMEDFTTKTGREDPVLHFYETFLREYDRKLREVRGVYYTPEPVVSYIVRSVDHILKTDFDMPDGLADERVFILDPACGTGTFLFFVIRHVHQTIVEKHGEGAWRDYVREKLLRRLFGFELLMAPYTIAHMKLAMLLQELGYDFPDDQRLGIYLTNTLQEAETLARQGFDRFLADEADSAREVKRKLPVMVVLGNPPYCVNSRNRGPWIRERMALYKEGVEKDVNLKPLHNDYVKFLLFSQLRIAQTGHGVVAMITAHSYGLDRVFRGMRAGVSRGFGRIQFLDLHGETTEECPTSGRTNVFDITQGVAISVWTRFRAHRDGEAEVLFHELYGTDHEAKGAVLASADVSTTDWQLVPRRTPTAPFRPLPEDTLREYGELPTVRDAFVVGNVGYQTHRDGIVVALDSAVLRARLDEMRDAAHRVSAVVDGHGLAPNRDWDPVRAVTTLRNDGHWDKWLARTLYRPFDVRDAFLAPYFCDFPRWEVMHHLGPGAAPALLFSRVHGERAFSSVFVSRLPTESKAADRTRGTHVCPLYLRPESGKGGTGSTEEGARHNLRAGFVSRLSRLLGLGFVEDGKGDLGETLGPEDVFDYVYAVLHSPTYRERYAEFLKIDFPRIPLTSDVGLFRRLCGLGSELVALHLMEHPVLEDTPAKLEPAGSNEMEAVKYDEKAQRVYINKAQYFAPVEPDLYAFQIGGYQVLNKWLKDRKGRVLTFEDVRHYGKVVVALRETRRLMAEIDEAIPGWPME
jgi:hypothetical protein